MSFGNKIKREVLRVDPFRKEEKSSVGVGMSATSIFQLLREYPASVQIGIGAASGLVTGYVSTKGSKVVAGFLGIGFVLYQFCSHRGYVKINRSRFEKDVERMRASIEHHLGYPKEAIPNETLVKKFLKDNQFLLSGFCGGCLLGYSFA